MIITNSPGTDFHCGSDCARQESKVSVLVALTAAAAAVALTRQLYSSASLESKSLITAATAAAATAVAVQAAATAAIKGAETTPMAAQGSRARGHDSAEEATGRRTTRREATRWSEPLDLREALGKAPVLVKLEDGSRGDVEALSFSLGDVLALEGDIHLKGQRVVLAHYMSSADGEDGDDVEQQQEEDGKNKQEQEVYRSLLTIPWECLPQVQVRVCLDPEGRAYHNFLNTHFTSCNWRGQQQQLLGSLDEDHYDTVQELPPHLARNIQRSASAPQSNRPPPPPPRPVSPHVQEPPPGDNFMLERPPLPPRRSLSENKAVRPHHYQADDIGDTLRPPPRPPRLTNTVGRSVWPEGKAGGIPGILFPSERPTGHIAPNQQVTDNDDENEDEDDEDYIDVDKQEKEEAEYKLKREQEEEERKQKIFLSTRKTGKTEQKKTDDTDRKDKKEKMYSTRTGEQADGQKHVGQASKTGLVKPMVRVHPLSSKPTSPRPRPKLYSPVTTPLAENSEDDDEDYEIPTSSDQPLHKMTYKQLSARLKLCGLPKLAKTCETNVLDGAFLSAMSDKQLRKPPFSLSDFDINVKLPQVKSGWVPK